MYVCFNIYNILIHDWRGGRAMSANETIDL